MTEWEYYYIEEENTSDGLFQLTRSDIDEDNPFDETVSFGKINLDFKDGEIAGIEIWAEAKTVVSPAWREGTVDNPETIEISRGQEEPESLINKLKDLGVIDR